MDRSDELVGVLWLLCSCSNCSILDALNAWMLQGTAVACGAARNCAKSYSYCWRILGLYSFWYIGHCPLCHVAFQTANVSEAGYATFFSRWQNKARNPIPLSPLAEPSQIPVIYDRVCS
jgi:hypothetical protein